MKIKPTVKLDSYSLSLTGVLEWGEVIARVLGYSNNEFANACSENQKMLKQHAVSYDPVGETVKLLYYKHNLDNTKEESNKKCGYLIYKLPKLFSELEDIAENDCKIDVKHHNKSD